MLNAVYAQDENMVFRRIGEEMILVPIRRRTADLQSIFTLNETGAFIWEHLDGTRTVAEIRDAMADEYEVAPEQAETDVLAFMQLLIEANGVRPVA